MRRFALAFLLLCSAAVADGPLFSIWHIDGHGYRWQQEQRDAGLPIEYTIRMVSSDLRNVPKQVTNLNSQAGLLSQLSGESVVLRMNNITSEIDLTIPRITPLTESTWQPSILCVRRKADGTLDQSPVPDPLGPVCQWSEVGRLWATSAWMVRLQEIVQPTAILLRENNEGPRQKFKALRTGTAWKSRAELLTVSIRAADWVDARRHLTPAACEAEFIASDNARYAALYAAFDANLSPAWRGKLKVVGYGDFSENLQNPSASVPYYIGGNTGISTLTDPRHESNIAAFLPQWREWRELSIRINPNAVYTGSSEGLHDAIDPENSAGFWTAMAWRLQGKPVRLVWWDNYNTKPTEPLGAWTLGDYETAVMRQLSRIHTHKTLNRYWTEGATRVVGSSLNDATANRVYATETTIPGDVRRLLFVYSPCTLAGEIPVGEWSVPGEGYWLTNSLVEVR